MGKSYLNQPDYPRGIRNNNPGNLVRTEIDWLGKVPHKNNPDARFEQFIEMRYGIRALMRDIITDFERGQDTVVKLISEFAPAFENNTASYITSVASMIGIGANTQIVALNGSLLIKLCRAIITVENGAAYAAYITEADYQDAYAILGKDLGSVKKKVKR